MKFYEATTKTGICQEIDSLCDSNDTAYSRLDKTRRVNSALEELVGMIINADGTWQYDDTNQTDAPRGKGTLVEGQEYYTFTSEYLQIEEIDVLDLNGRYIRLEPIDPADLNGISPDDYFGVDDSGNPQKGMPEYYDIKGDSIRLYPAPGAAYCTLASGIRVSFKRTASLFTAVSTTADDATEPGLPSTHHLLLAYMAAIPYNEVYHPQRVARQEKKIDEMKKTLIQHYAQREINRRGIITTRHRSFR